MVDIAGNNVTYLGLHVNCLIRTKFRISRQIFIEVHNINFYGNPFSGSPADIYWVSKGQRRTNAISHFRDYANGNNKWSLKSNDWVFTMRQASKLNKFYISVWRLLLKLGYIAHETAICRNPLIASITDDRKTWWTINKPTLKHVVFQRIYKKQQFSGDNILTEGVFLTKLSSNVGISDLGIVWFTKNGCFMSDMTLGLIKRPVCFLFHLTTPLPTSSASRAVWEDKGQRGI